MVGILVSFSFGAIGLFSRGVCDVSFRKRCNLGGSKWVRENSQVKITACIKFYVRKMNDWRRGAFKKKRGWSSNPFWNQPFLFTHFFFRLQNTMTPWSLVPPTASKNHCSPPTPTPNPNLLRDIWPHAWAVPVEKKSSSWRQRRPSHPELSLDKIWEKSCWISGAFNSNKSLTWHEPWNPDWILILWLIEIILTYITE